MKRLLALLTLTLGLILPLAAPALAEDDASTVKGELSLILEGLKKENLYISETGEVALMPQLEKALKGSSVGVVVLPGSGAMKDYNKVAEEWDELYDSYAELVYNYVDQDKYRTIIVLSKNNFTLHSNQSTESLKTLLEGSSALDPEKIILNMDKIEDWNQITFNEWGWVLIIPGIIVGIVALVLLWGLGEWIVDTVRKFFRGRSKRKQAKAQAREQAKAEARAEEEERQRNSITQEINGELPKDLSDKLNKIQSWTSNSIAKDDREFALEIKEMVSRFLILFERLNDRGTPQQKNLVMVSYSDMLNKISLALSDRYYLDIVQHPGLWDNPEDRIAQVKKAVAGTSFQLLENIKQINGARDLDFKAALEALAGFMDAPNVEDLYGDSKSKKGKK